MKLNDIAIFYSRLLTSTVWAFLFCLFPFMVKAETPLCTDIHTLVEHSRSKFTALIGEGASEFGGTHSKFTMSDAWYCVIDEDIEKSSHRCTWKYPYVSNRAQRTYQETLAEINTCIGADAREYKAKPVNHPDSYESYIYQLQDNEIRVTLKNKIALNSKLISIIVETGKSQY